MPLTTVSACGYSSAGHLSSFRLMLQELLTLFVFFREPVRRVPYQRQAYGDMLNSVNNSPEASGAMTSNTVEIGCSAFRK